jgi:anti-anti-sigma factor
VEEIEMMELSREGIRVNVKPGGNIVASGINELRAKLKPVIDDGGREIIFDLEGVRMIDSIGLGLLIATHNSLAGVGGKLKIVNASKDLLDLFRNMRLDQHFEVRLAG